jgi:hypothetical protein
MSVQTSIRPRAYVRPISLADLPELRTLAAADRHKVVAPTHVAVNAGEIVGYASIGALPAVVCWTDSRRTVKTEGFRFLREVEGFAAERYQDIMLVCTPHSPFRPFLERVGYQFLGNADFLQKKVRS